MQRRSREGYGNHSTGAIRAISGARFGSRPRAKLAPCASANDRGIENGLHWVLDVAFGEDLNRARQKNAQANLGVLRRVAVSMIKNTPNLKGSMKSKRRQAGWNIEILEAIVFGSKM